jgi:hypothetical protein
MRKRNNSTAVVLLVLILVGAFLAYKVKQSATRDSLQVASRGSSDAPHLEVRKRGSVTNGVSTQDSNEQVSHPANSSQVRIGPPDIYPDSNITPGATNPSIIQGNIQDNICNPKWSTSSIRPPTSFTTRLKIEQLAEYGETNVSPRNFEEDHLIPLEIGGDPTNPKNLWPEPYYTSIPDRGARSKDRVENYLHRRVCGGDLMVFGV